MKKLKIEIYADGAEIKEITKLSKINYIKGFTTNPSLMRKSGITNYEKFCKDALKISKNKPISFEVFSDDLKEIKNQALKIASWSKNIYVKIPITNTKNISTNTIIKELNQKDVKLNITAIFTKKQIDNVLKNINKKTNCILSIFAGRIADTGSNPENIVKYAVKKSKKFKNVKILWASTREAYNIFQASELNCHIITVPNEILNKLNIIGKNLNQYSLETVKSFYSDALKSGYKI